MIGGRGDDILRGGNGDDNMTGGLGSDRFITGQGSDIVRGGAGDDYVTLGSDYAASDRLDGGDGWDIVSYSSSFGQVYVDLADPTLNSGEALNDRIVNVEAVVGSYLYGDTLLGDAGANALDGEGGDDVLNGRAGADRLIGGDGLDTLAGGAGADVFVLEVSSTLPPEWYAEPTHDEIMDFTRGEDTLEVSAALFGTDITLTTGSGVSFTGSGPSLHFDTASSQLWFDYDGAGTAYAAELVVTLHGVDNLAMQDFTFVA